MPSEEILNWLNRRISTPVTEPTVKYASLIEKEDKKDISEDRAHDYDYDADEEPYVSVGVGSLIAASEKLLAVNRGLEEPDHRDRFTFKKFFPPNKLISQRIRTDVGNVRKKMLRMAAHRKNLSALGPLAFEDYTEKQIVGNALSSPLEEINPIQLVESARRVTQMGPGGIQSSDSITPEMQSVEASQFGFLDPLAGPESERIGVDARITWGTRLGSNGRVYQVFRNKRTGEYEWKSAEDLDGKYVKLPD
jgi:DNA-directed RNA polymerase beta subunit